MGQHFPTYLTKLQRLQNKALLVIGNAVNLKTSATFLYHNYNILKIEDNLRLYYKSKLKLKLKSSENLQVYLWFFSYLN